MKTLKEFKNIAKDVLGQGDTRKWKPLQDGTDELVKKYKEQTPFSEESEHCTLYTPKQLKDLETFADRLLNKYGVDIEFTKHFGERMSDERNKPCIKLSELQQFFKKLEKQKASKIKQHGEGQAVLVDLQKDLNLPVVIDMIGDTFEVRMKTIMRKKNFQTSNDKISVD